MMRNAPIVTALMCGVVIFLNTGLTWATLIKNQLNGIELDSTPVETKIVLRSDSKIPNKIVSYNREKIVIDLDSVDTSQSVPTDFANADNINQVVLKPINNSKIRMVIRGDRLGAPVVNLITPLNLKNDQDRQVVTDREVLSSQTLANVKVPDENGFSMTAIKAPVKEKLQEQSKNVSENKNSKENNNPDASPVTEDIEAINVTQQGDSPVFEETSEYDAMDSQDLMQALESDRKALVAPEKIEDTTLSDNNEEATWQDIVIAGLQGFYRITKNLFEHTDKDLLFRILAFSGLGILITMFIRHKISQERNNTLLDNYEEPSSPGFLQKFFSSRRSSKPRKNQRLPRLFDENTPSADYISRRTGERPVGLRGLANNSYVDSPLSTAKGSLNRIVNQNHALNQYAQNADSPLTHPPYREGREIDRELRRSLDTRQAISKTQSRNTNIFPKKTPASQPVTPPPSTATSQNRMASRPQNRALPPQATPAPRAYQASKASNAQPNKTGSEAAGFPANNTEVLDFLRSVAELMEKDGRSELAKGLKKGIRPNYKP